MISNTIVLFGETEKGEYRVAYLCKNLEQLVENLGNPPSQSQGIYYAVQALLFHYQLVFFRVKEEGFSLQDYAYGAQLLQNQSLISNILAICMPGVGDDAIYQAISPLCAVYHSILITNESDLYDYLTAARQQLAS